MKKLIFFLLILIPTLGFSQLTTTNPDTVCYQTPGSIYQVPSLGAGYTYNWTVTAPGVITSGQGTNQIGVNWSAASPGLITNGISVTATGPGGCTSTPVNLNVFILNVVPTITAIGPFCQGAPCVTLAATPLGGTFSGPGVSNGQFCPTSAGIGTHTITYTYTSNGCTFTATTTVTVNTLPVLSPIQHN
jgi:hypothetical protein